MRKIILSGFILIILSGVALALETPYWEFEFEQGARSISTGLETWSWINNTVDEFCIALSGEGFCETNSGYYSNTSKTFPTDENTIIFAIFTGTNWDDSSKFYFGGINTWQQYFLIDDATNNWRYRYYVDSSHDCNLYGNKTMGDNQWWLFAITHSNTPVINMFVNGTPTGGITHIASSSSDCGSANHHNGDPLYIGRLSAANQFPVGAIIDSFKVYGSVLSEAQIEAEWANIVNSEEDTTPPVVSDVNCTSVLPDGDSVSPYTTYDTTPTFSFTTDEKAYCRIGDEDQNYTTMGDSRNCSTGEGNTSHVCSIIVEDELYIPTDYAYIACTDANGNENITSSKILLMDITDLETNTSKAIDLGIQSSTIWPTTVHNSQQIYLRDIDNNQLLTTVDRVAVFNSQRWLLNYVVDSSLLGLFNITPVIYALDMTNISLTQIENQVSGLINLTKS
ncbi:MAG: LamG-like jellyroll fold domain-containing protein [Nanoarchaeota archaeon]